MEDVAKIDVEDDKEETYTFSGNEKYHQFDINLTQLSGGSSKMGEHLNAGKAVFALVFVDDKTNETTLVWSSNAPDHDAMTLAYSIKKQISLDDARYQKELKVEVINSSVGVYSKDRNLRSKAAMFFKASAKPDTNLGLSLSSTDINKPLYFSGKLKDFEPIKQLLPKE